MFLKVKILFMTFLVFVFAGGGMAMAQEGGQKAPSAIILVDGDHSGHNMDGMDMSGKDKNMDMSEHQDVQGSTNGDDMEGMDMKEDSHSHEPVKETPPNAKVLGTYGAVNLAFVVIGVWNKWFKRKEGLDGNSK